MTEKNKIYTAADFARYHSGIMPASEMHALEKAALEDPFLADALEGYTNTRDAESDIEELKTRLDEKKKKKIIFSISSVSQNNWWRIAALFILVVGAGYFIYRTNSVDKENSIAKNEIKRDTAKTQILSPVNTDSTVNKNDIAFENQPSSKLEKKRKVPLPMTPLLEKKVIAPQNYTESAISQSSEEKVKRDYYADSTGAKIPGKENDSAKSSGYVLKGKITDNIGAPVPFASIADHAHRNASIADASGYFTFHSQDSNISATINATGFSPKSFRLKKDSDNTIVMNKNNAELTTVVVTSAYGAKKRSKKVNAAPNESSGKVTSVQIAPSGLQPVGGQQKFEQYVKDSAVSIIDEYTDLIIGEVSLSFTIDNEGRPKDIRVTQSSCEACEPEAIRLIENGPGWSGKKNDHGNIIIKF